MCVHALAVLWANASVCASWEHGQEQLRKHWQHIRQESPYTCVRSHTHLVTESGQCVQHSCCAAVTG